MIIDSHYHLEESILTAEELLNRMDVAGVDMTALMGSQILQFPEPARWLVGVNQFLITHGPTRPISKLIISNFTDKGIKILGTDMEIFRDPDNSLVFSTVDKYPDRFLGWIFVNPNGKKDQVEEFDKYKNHPGFIGVKAHPFWNHHTPMDLAPVAEKLVQTGKPLLIHPGFNEEGNYNALVDRVPGLKLILAHAGFPLYRETWNDIRDTKNIFVDLSQTSYVGDGATRDVVNFLGPERCIFGTDGPYGFHGDDETFDYGYIKRRIESIFPDEGVRRRILGENFAELINIA